ncbi:isopentenyl phosphate kinase [Salinibaculum rarum]|uniref:isopentenyl phosphate kinase n=1 Tax=Salinibaculum rarum TaxID=3058903 RepID=UPI00265E9150|nr:isopentenyl phosphate kinase [Salinibaculum sp. KK48]
MTTILKLGGSIITHKDRPETVDRETVDRVVETIAGRADSTVGDLVVVHGGGSFGHHHAAAHGVSSTDGTSDVTALTEIHAAMTELNDAIVDAFQDHDIPALPVRPLSVAHRDASGTLTLPAGQIATMLGEGFVPVVHGDVVAHVTAGGTILSGDDIVVSLAESLDARRVGLCSTVPGVLDNDGAVVPEIETFEDVADSLGGSDATDVTGGMAGKVRALLDLETPASIFDPGELDAFLEGASVGTVVRGTR